MAHDLVNQLLGIKQSQWNYETRCEYKNKQPRPHLQMIQVDGKRTRKFQDSWYTKFSWLTGSVVRDKVFCYVCILFCGESEWSRSGILAVKNFIRMAQTHQRSLSHIRNLESFHMLGREKIHHTLSQGARASAIKHNGKVKTNRRILERIIDVVCFLGRQELVFHDHHEDETSTNKGNYLEMLDLLAEKEIIMRDHLDSDSVFNGTSNNIQNEMIATVTEVLNDAIRDEIKEAQFISVQVDETTDVSCKCKLSIIFRYSIECRVEERFVGFYDISADKDAHRLSNVIINALEEWEVDKKLVCQTYDGAMFGEKGEVQDLVKKKCPYALFVHCYAHQLNLVLLHGLKSTKQIRVFNSSLAGFHKFFSKVSKRTAFLKEQGINLLSHSSTWWNYYSRATTTIKAHFSDLRLAFNHIIDDPNWDPVTLGMAIELNNHFNQPTFVFLLTLFSKIFVHVDHVFNVLQLKGVSDVNDEIKEMVTSVKNLRNYEFTQQCCEESSKLNNDLEFPEKLDFEKLKFVNIVNEQMFIKFNHKFPEGKLDSILENYPFFEREMLKNELIAIYEDPNKHKAPRELLKYLFDNDMCEVYSQVTLLLRLILTLPMTPPSPEHNMCTLKRVKSYLRNSMENELLSNLSSLSIERVLLKSLSKDQTFKDQTIDKFAASKNCSKMPLLYKSI